MSWHACALGEVVKLQRGHDLPERLRVTGSVPVVSSSGVTGWHNVAKAEPPGVVTGRYGTIGEVFFIEEPYWPLNTALYVVDFKGNDPRFVSYLLRNTLRARSQSPAVIASVIRANQGALPCSGSCAWYHCSSASGLLSGGSITPHASVACRVSRPRSRTPQGH